ncbi:unnamed protein product [Anisakis simplex]|uniref:7TM_GPCR_Srx domain-containing protein n=1 Tax=Anisakis simplex TaxID=6269 RepID=A0A0M3IY65_ANISI|nr:unnamed protein product [Anisakis simplex]
MDVWYSHTSAQLANGSYYVTVFMHLLGTLNRCVAIFWPFVYQRTFSSHRTIAYILVIFLMYECELIFKKEFYSWWFSNANCGTFENFYIDFILTLAVEILMILIDGLVIIRLHRTRKVTHSLFSCSLFSISSQKFQTLTVYLLSRICDADKSIAEPSKTINVHDFNCSEQYVFWK